jgi:hypothetical protein
MTGVKQGVPGVESLASDQTPGLDLSAWLSTGMGAVPVSFGGTADPAALVWRNCTIPQPRSGVAWRPTIVRRVIRPTRQPVAPNAPQDLAAEELTAQDFAAWARSMVGGEAPDMLDI